MNNQHGFGLTSYLAAGSILTIFLLGYGLWQQIEANGALESQNAQLVSDIKETEKAFKELERQERKKELVVIDNIQEKQVIEKENEVVKWKVREVVKRVPAEDCLNTPVHPDLDSLLSGSHEAGSEENISSDGADSRPDDA